MLVEMKIDELDCSKVYLENEKKSEKARQYAVNNKHIRNWFRGGGGNSKAGTLGREGEGSVLMKNREREEEEGGLPSFRSFGSGSFADPFTIKFP